MIRIRNFVTITTVILIVFFLFASQGMARLRLSDKGVNPYRLTLEKDSGDSYLSSRCKKNYIYIGHDKTLKKRVTEYATLRKSKITYSGFSKAASDAEGNGTVVLVDGSLVKESSIGYLQKILDRDATIVFLTMPDEALIESNDSLRELLGIQRIRGNIHVRGYQMFSGFMLGGEAYYVEDDDVSEKKSRQDLPLDITYYEVASSCRLYMIGQIDADKQGIRDLDDDNTKGPLDSEDYPAIIWQHGLYDGRVFCVNAPFMETDAGYGILSAIEYETSEVLVTGFADTRSLVASSFPSLADENEDQIVALYGQNSYNFQRNVLWPYIVSAGDINNDRITLMSCDHIRSGAGDYSREDSFLSLAENERAETGVMGGSADTVKEGLHSYFPDYEIRSYYGSGRDGVVVTDRDNAKLFSQKNNTLTVKQTESADSMKFSDDLRLRGIVTATGYYLTNLDMSKVMYPSGKDERYEEFSRTVSGNLKTYYGRFSYLTPLTLSQAGSRISAYLNTDMSVRWGQDRNRIIITLSSSGNSSRLLMRTHGQEIKNIAGATYEKAEDDCYILTAEGDRIVVSLTDADRPEME